MAWDPDSVARSVRRYLGLLLPEPWNLRTQKREVPDEQRPTAVVRLGQMTSTAARTSLEQGQVQKSVPVTVYAYPALTAEDDDVRLTATEAQRLRGDLYDLIDCGLVVRDLAGKDWAGPYVLPLWDYSATPPIGDEAARSGPVYPHDVMWVDRASLNADAIQDPDDPRRWTVVLEFRASVEAPGRTTLTGDEPVVTSVPGSFIPVPE